MSAWHRHGPTWKMAAVFGLVCGAFALFLASWSVVDAYVRSAMPWSLVILAVVAVGAVALIWQQMATSGRSGLVWSAHWLIGWMYTIPAGRPVIALIVPAILLPIAALQIMVGYWSWRDSGGCETASRRGFAAVRILASIITLVVFLVGFRLTGLSWPTQRTCKWEVSRLSSLHFPHSAELAKGYLDYAPLSSMVLAKLEMPSVDAKTFVEMLPQSRWLGPSTDAHDLRTGNGPDPQYRYPRWFAPKQAKCQVFHPCVEGWDSVNVLVEQDASERSTVYVYCYED